MIYMSSLAPPAKLRSGLPLRIMPGPGPDPGSSVMKCVVGIGSHPQAQL